jgi:ATP-dependent helicase HrpB
MGRPSLAALPIDPLLPEIVASLHTRGAVVIEAPPGAGKTTRVPPALLDAGFGQRGEIVVLQPRRLPARLAAERVATERGERTGETVGYTVRFAEEAGPHTRIRFVTEGILLRRLLGDPRLSGVEVVILDEFHERHLSSDLALALLRRLQLTQRPDLCLLAMSATLEADPVCQFLGDCPLVRSEGRQFEIFLEYLPQPDVRPLHDQVASAVRRLCQEGLDGDVLVFLPGAAEIRRATEKLAPLSEARDLLLLPLHGDLSPAEQRRAVEPASRRKVILSTNVAETSVTIDGVVAVVDSGLARIASHSPWSGLPVLAVSKISQASAVQRAGRAGRTRPGRALRLFTQHDFDSRRPHEIPEIARLDLGEALLTLAALGVHDREAFDWFEPPAAAALQSAHDLLRRLGALDSEGWLTDTGQQILRFPVHPRLGRLIVEGERRGVGEDAAALAALVAEGDISDTARTRFAGQGQPACAPEGGDLLERLDRFRQARAARFARERLRGLGVDVRAAEAAELARRQLASTLRRDGPVKRPTQSHGEPAGPSGRTTHPAHPARFARALAGGVPSSREAERSERGGVAGGGPKGIGTLPGFPNRPDAVDEILAMATLAAFPDRVMRRRSPGSSEALLASGGVAKIGAQPPDDLLCAVDVEERTGPGARSGNRAVSVRLAVGIRPEWLLDIAPGELTERDEIQWNADRQRVERVCRLLCGAITLEESHRPAPPSAEASRLLSEAVLGNGRSGEERGEAPAALQAKLEVLRQAFPEASVPALGAKEWQALVAAACEGITSLVELQASPIENAWLASLPPGVARLLREEVPERIRLAGGRVVPVNYEAGKPPWIESRLQDFFGTPTGPSICRGRVPLTLHLLAPNRRAVQVTSDLASFWRQHYPTLRRELCRRYPRHPWPEDGATATPPVPSHGRPSGRKS